MRFLQNILVMISILISYVSFSQTVSQKGSVLVNATVSTAPSITITWNSFSGSTGYVVHRKLKNASSWTQLGSTTGTSYTDNSVSIGTYYEYKVVRSTTNAGTGYGYIASGIEIPAVDSRGKMILLVDNTFTSSLSSQLTQLTTDLRADGWVVIRHDVSRTASVSSIKSIIQTDYNADPSNVKAVFLFGHVPVPRSGNLNPDGHGDHIGAWSADGFYGDVNGTWTDNSVNNSSAQLSMNYNVPGDGKYDQSDFPSPLELQVGRVDLANLSAFASTIGNEQTLLSNYLTKLHNFKTKQFTPQFRGIVFDNFADPVMEQSASSGHRSISANIGITNMQVPSGTGSPFSTYVNGQSYLWTYACGGGSWSTCSNVGSTSTFAQTNFSMGGVFNMCIGSYFGDWDVAGNFMRAYLGSGNALTNVWSGWPNFWMHHMGMGDNIGYSTLISMNNVSLYTLQNGGWHGQPYSRVHMGLMGDPSLRQISVNMPSALQIENMGGLASFSWNSASGSPMGYNVYDLGDGSSLPVRLNSSIITGNTWSSPTIPFISNRQYMVRAVKLETGVTGSYYNMSLGAIATSSNIQPVLVSAKVFLAGPYNQSSGMMNDVLKTVSNFPLSDPYPVLGYVHTGNGTGTISSTVLSVSGNNSIVDWIVIELRSTSAPYSVVASKSVLLQRDGNIVDRDGVSPVSFYVNPGNYRISLIHRNHLGIMTGNSINLSTSVTTIDFSNISTTVYGTNARKQIGSIAAMIAGDANSNRQLKYTGSGNDRDAILVGVGGTTPNVSVSTYSTLDINLDGVIKFTGSGNDRDIILTTIGSENPSNVINTQLP